MMARSEAILGSCPDSLESLRSGIRSWVLFAETVLGSTRPFPPTEGGLLAWSRTFRHRLCTFAPQLCGSHRGARQVSQDVFQLFGLCEGRLHAGRGTRGGLRRPSPQARQGCRQEAGRVQPKREALHPASNSAAPSRSCRYRCPLPADRDVGISGLHLPSSVSRASHAVACALACVSRGRVPSECLPMRTSAEVVEWGPKQPHHSMVWPNDQEIVLYLRKRKNMPQGCRRQRRPGPSVVTAARCLLLHRIIRKCWCRRSKETCPVHVLGAWLRCAPRAAPRSTRPCASHLAAHCPWGQRRSRSARRQWRCTTCAVSWRW